MVTSSRIPFRAQEAFLAGLAGIPFFLLVIARIPSLRLCMATTAQKSYIICAALSVVVFAVLLNETISDRRELTAAHHEMFELRQKEQRDEARLVEERALATLDEMKLWFIAMMVSLVGAAICVFACMHAVVTLQRQQTGETESATSDQ